MKNFIILDVETTGLSSSFHDIIEIAAIKVDGSSFEIINTFSELIKINKNIDFFITNLTGITNSDLNNKGKNLINVLKDINIFCGSLPIYAHNAPFDKSFIRHSLDRCNILYNKNKWINTVPIFRKKWPKPKVKNHKLQTLISYHKLANKQDHRALSDVKHTLTLLKMAWNK